MFLFFQDFSPRDQSASEEADSLVAEARSSGATERALVQLIELHRPAHAYVLYELLVKGG